MCMNESTMKKRLLTTTRYVELDRCSPYRQVEVLSPHCVSCFQRLSNRPPPFRVRVDDGRVDLFMNPYVAAHRAASHFGGQEEVEVDYCLRELVSMREPDTKAFSVPNSDAFEEAKIDGLVLPLYKRQAKALTRMQAIENGEVSTNKLDLRCGSS